MLYAELFKLESFLVNSNMNLHQYNVVGSVPLSYLIGKTKYGIWDTYQVKGMWIVITIDEPLEANEIFQTLLEEFPKLPLENAIIMLENQNCEYKIVISVKETEV